MVLEREGPELRGVQLHEAPALLLFLVCSVLARLLCSLRESEPLKRFPETSVLIGGGISSAELNEVFSWPLSGLSFFSLFKKYLFHPFFGSGIVLVLVIYKT